MDLLFIIFCRIFSLWHNGPALIIRLRAHVLPSETWSKMLYKTVKCKGKYVTIFFQINAVRENDDSRGRSLQQVMFITVIIRTNWILLLLNTEHDSAMGNIPFCRTLANSLRCLVLFVIDLIILICSPSRHVVFSLLFIKMGSNFNDVVASPEAP